MIDQQHIFVTCPKGVEDLLVSECQQLGITEIQQTTGGVDVTGVLEDAYKLCLWSRLASRVLVRLKTFHAESYDELYTEVQHIDWSEHISENGSFAIDCFSKNEQLNNSHYATLKTKDAIVDQFVSKYDSRPNVERDRPDVRINVYLDNKTSIVYLDLSGEPLHIRGYRKQTGSAPLKENLAAAILLRCKWPELAKQGLPLYDPMCGSGTLLIEAAYIAGNIAPGYLRTYYGFSGWKQHDNKTWEKLYKAAGDIANKDAIPLVAGSDNSKNIINVAAENISSAGLDKHISVCQQDVSQPAENLTGKTGLLVTNPPYGKRLGQIEQLKNVYFKLGQSLKINYSGWKAAVFTSDDRLAKCIALRSHHKNTLYNGPLKCILYQYNIRDTGEKPKVITERHESADMFENRLKKNFKHLRKWASKNDISCYRVYDADLPQYAFAVDIYESWVHVQEYEPPKTVDTVKAMHRLNDAVDIIAEVMDIDQNNVVLKTRKIQSGSEQYSRHDEKHRYITVTENNLKFRVNLYDYLDTGLFIDHRRVRQLIKKFANGKSFLNLFAYTGTASVYAAAGGARSTTTVDMSNTYLDWARENFRINNIKGNNHQFVRADCMQWLWDAKKAGHSYQLILLDPPTFSNSKKMAKSFDVSRDHVELIDLTMRLLDEKGMLIFSCNAKRFKLAIDELASYHIQELTKLTTTEDFKRRPLHSSWCLSKQPLTEKIVL